MEQHRHLNKYTTLDLKYLGALSLKGKRKRFVWKNEKRIRFPHGTSLATVLNVHFYDRSLKICRITNIAEIIISRYGAKSNLILAMSWNMTYVVHVHQL